MRFLGCPGRSSSLLAISLILLCIVGFNDGANTLSETHGIEISALWLYPGFYANFGTSFAIDRQRVETENMLARRGMFGDILPRHSTSWKACRGQFLLASPQSPTNPCVALASGMALLVNVIKGIFMTSKVVQNVSESECIQIATSHLLAGFNETHPFSMWIIGDSRHIPCADVLSKDARFSKIPQFVAESAELLPLRNIISLNTYEARFIHGVVCALSVGNVGAVGIAVPTLKGISENAQSLHAFAAGVHHVATNIPILVAETYSVYGEMAHRRAVDILIDKGAKCIASSIPTLSPYMTASARNVQSVALQPFARQFAGELVLVNLAIRWEQALQELIADYFLKNDSGIQVSASIRNDTIQIIDLSTRMDQRIMVGLSDTWAALATNQLDVFCSPHYNVPMHSNDSYLASHGSYCLTEEGRHNIQGIPLHAELVVKFDKKNVPFVQRYVRWGYISALVLIALDVTLIIVALLGLMTVLCNFRNRVYKRASPLFLILILLGILLGCASCFLWIGLPTPTKCLLPWWFTGISLTTIYSCVLAKNYRVWRTLSSKTVKKDDVVDLDLVAKFVLSQVFFEASMLITISLYDPPKPYLRANVPFLKYYELQNMCHVSDKVRPFIITLVVYHLLLSLASAFISFKTRKAPKEHYREHTSVSLTIGISIVIQVLVLLAPIAVPNDYRVQFYMNGYGVWALMFTAYCGFFFPKFYRAHFSHSLERPPATPEDQKQLTDNTESVAEAQQEANTQMDRQTQPLENSVELSLIKSGFLPNSGNSAISLVEPSKSEEVVVPVPEPEIKQETPPEERPPIELSQTTSSAALNPTLPEPLVASPEMTVPSMDLVEPHITQNPLLESLNLAGSSQAHDVTEGPPSTSNDEVCDPKAENTQGANTGGGHSLFASDSLSISQGPASSEDHPTASAESVGRVQPYINELMARNHALESSSNLAGSQAPDI